MADELMKLDELQGTGIQKYDDKVFDSLTSQAFLPRIQLMTSNSEKCKSGEFPINHYAIVRDQTYKDLGVSVDVLVCGWRPKAMLVGDQVISRFDHESDAFKALQAKSEEKDSKCMWGYEFLVWVPSQRVFGAFFMGSKSARREAPHVKARMNKPATLASKKIETSQYTWYGPQVSDCSTPFDMPTKEDFLKEMTKFSNPPESEVEVAKPGETSGRAQ
jgi:hypothetical protein